MKLTFWGAARQVTGSMFLLETGSNENFDRYNILIDCGQNLEPKREIPVKLFPFDPTEISLVVLTHAHIDHSGMLPLLIKEGYEGQILCTKPTAELTEILLKDSANLNAKKAKFIEGSKKKSKKLKDLDQRTLFFEKQVKEVTENIVCIGFNKRFRVADDVYLTFFPAGHLLGAAHAIIEVKEEGKIKKIGFSGDIGRKNFPLLVDPEPLPPVDYLVTETTYGNRYHQDTRKPEDVLKDIIQETCIDTPGRLIIPAFSVGRTQALLYSLHKLYSENGFTPIKVFTDSPLASASTKIYERNIGYLNDRAKQDKEHYKTLFDFENLEYVESLKTSKSISDYFEPCIIISASGMISGGRVEHHIEANISNPYATIFMVGYASEGTLGYDLVHGNRDSLTIGDKAHPILAKIKQTDVFSGHGDLDDLLDFVKNQSSSQLSNIFLTHGDEKAMEDFKNSLAEEGFTQVEIPYFGQTFVL